MVVHTRLRRQEEAGKVQRSKKVTRDGQHKEKEPVTMLSDVTGMRIRLEV